MGRSKTKTQTTSLNSRDRKESRSERRAREQADKEAIERCQRLLPFAGGCIFVFMIIFALYVRSVPKRQPVLVNKLDPYSSRGDGDFKLDSVVVNEKSGEMTETWVGNEEGLNVDPANVMVGTDEQTIEL